MYVCGREYMGVSGTINVEVSYRIFAVAPTIFCIYLREFELVLKAEVRV